MSLKDKLSDPDIAQNSRPGPPCKIGTLLSSRSQMPDDDKEYLAMLMSIDVRSPEYKSVNSIVVTLRDEGYDVNKTCIINHRRKVCRCFGSSPKV